MKRRVSKALVMLRPSKIDGIGCFADIKIGKGEIVRLWDGKDSEWVPLRKAHASRHAAMYRRIGIRNEGGYWAPKDFLIMSAGWYINHSTEPNVQSDDGDRTYYALRDIPPGEELTMDYRRMDETHDNLTRDVVLTKT